ncbi:efflux RND transporter permease subunit, partial [Acidithiobacillus sp.]|uniref:efflux RND transporter permease subunit n=1 Tax=Acidithiobacillus sp. TaxID=1872118 RepID=UPI003D07557C
YDRYLTTTDFDKVKSRAVSFAVNGVGIGGMLLNNEVMAGVVLKPHRDGVTTQQVRQMVQQLAEQVPGMKLSAFGLPPLPGSAVGLPVQFVLTSTSGNYHQLDSLAREIIDKAKASGKFAFICKNLKYNNQIDTIHINRLMAASFGLSMADIGKNLETLLGGNYVNYFDMKGLSYRVVPQVPPALRANPDFLKSYTIATASGAQIPLSTLVTLETHTAPTYLPQFGQLPSVTIEANPAPGVSLGQALSVLQKSAKQ